MIGTAAVSRETRERLALHLALLRKWNRKINLVSRSTLDLAEHRHTDDSLQLLALAPDTATRWIDLGSGGGFPGLVIAIAAVEHRPAMHVTLIESDARKAAFLRTVLRECEIDATVLASRIEAAPSQEGDVVSARALAPLPALLNLAEPHMVPGAVGLFLKGAAHAEEVREALERWRFTCEKFDSATSPDGAILRIGELRRA